MPERMGGRLRAPRFPVRWLAWPALAFLACAGPGDRPAGSADGVPCVSQVTLTDEPVAVYAPFEFVAAELMWPDDSTFILVDQSDQQVVVLNVDGSERMRLGREGDGPGEFRAVGSVIAHPDSGYLATGYQRVTRFFASGELAGTVLLPGMIVQLTSWDGAQGVAAWIVTGVGPRLTRINTTTYETEELFAPFERDTTLVTKLAFGMVNPFVLFADLGGGEILVAEPTHYRFAAFDLTGRATRAFGRPELGLLARDELDRAEMEANLRHMFRDSPPQVQASLPDAVAGLQDVPKPHFTGPLRIDGEGRLWAITTRRAADSTELDVLHPEQGFLGSVRIPHRVSGLAFRGNRVTVLSAARGGPFDGQYALTTYEIARGGCDPETSHGSSP